MGAILTQDTRPVYCLHLATRLCIVISNTQAALWTGTSAFRPAAAAKHPSALYELRHRYQLFLLINSTGSFSTGEEQQHNDHNGTSRYRTVTREVEMANQAKSSCHKKQTYGRPSCSRRRWSNTRREPPK